MSERVEPGTHGGRADPRLLQAERERNFLIAVCLLLCCLTLLGRAGGRVWAIAVFDPRGPEFVERAYLPQKAQAEAVLASLFESARAAHPFYKENPADFQAARPSFQEPVIIRRVRRVVPLPDRTDSSADLPIQRAAAALREALHVQVDGWGLYDVEKMKPLVVMPTESMVAEARDARLENVKRKVTAQLKAPNYLVGEPTFLQKVDIRKVEHWPLEQVLGVQQAVDYLTQGEAPGLYVVQTTDLQGRDGLTKLAQKHGATVEDLGKWNPGRDLKLLAVGDRLVVRKPEPPLTVLTIERRVWRGRTYEIRRHDGGPAVSSTPLTGGATP